MKDSFYKDIKAIVTKIISESVSSNDNTNSENIGIVLGNMDSFLNHISIGRYVDIDSIEKLAKQTCFVRNELHYSCFSYEEFEEYCSKFVAEKCEKYGVNLGKHGLSCEHQYVLLNALHVSDDDMNADIAFGYAMSPLFGCEVGDILPITNSIALFQAIIAKEMNKRGDTDLLIKLLNS